MTRRGAAQANLDPDGVSARHLAVVRLRRPTILAALGLAGLAILALLPQAWGSAPRAWRSAPADEFRPFFAPAAATTSEGSAGPTAPEPARDPALGTGSVFVEPDLGAAPALTPPPAVAQPAAVGRRIATANPAPPALVPLGSGGGRYSLTGWASWYANGTTAMRLARGTRVRICGPAACVDRIVNDYGPSAAVFPGRIADLMPADFVTVCGCSTSKGTVRVTATVY